MVEFFHALSNFCIVALLIYFLIYYRKPLKSVLEALGDTDKLKAGPLEFKRRKQQQLKKIVNVIEDDSLKKADSHGKQLLLKVKLFITCDIALSLGLPNLVENDKDVLRIVKMNYEEVYKDISSLKTNNPELNLTLTELLKDSSLMISTYKQEYDSL